MIPERLVTVDPGVHGSGVCYWYRGVLGCAEYRTSPLDVDDAAGVVVVCELMVVYPGGRHAADLVDVSFAAGVICANYPDTIKVPAREWKGQVPKKIHHERLSATASEYELAIIKGVPIRDSLRHNVWDAYGIGKWYLRKAGA